MWNRDGEFGDGLRRYDEVFGGENMADMAAGGYGLVDLELTADSKVGVYICSRCSF